MAAEVGIKGLSSPSSTPINRSETGDELLLALLALLALLLDLVGEGGDASGSLSPSSLIGTLLLLPAAGLT